MKIRISNPFHSRLAALALVLVAPLAHAAPITWGTAGTIAADTDVLTAGALNYAYNFSNVNQTVNGVLFTGTNVGSGAIGSNVTMGAGWINHPAFQPSPDAAPWNTLSTAYQGMLQGGDYTGTTGYTVTLQNLTSGRVYATQIWVNDSRSAGIGRTETVTSTGGNSVTLDYNNTDANGGVGQYTTGRFLADVSNTQVFTLQSTTSTQINAFQVREVTNIGNWVGTGGATWDASTTNNFASNLFSDALVTTNFAAAKAPLNAVTFADSYWDAGVAFPVTQTNVTVEAAGVSTGTVLFDNSLVNYTIDNASGNIGITGATALVKNGSGTVTLTGANTYTGTTTISGGTLQIGNGGATGSLNSASPIVNNGALVYNIAGGAVNVNKTLSGSGTVSVTGNQAVNFAAGTTINTTGSQTYSATATSGFYYGLALADNATVALTSSAGISMTGMLGTAGGGVGNLNINTSAGNGNVTLDVAVGQPFINYGLNSLTVNAGTGTISLGKFDNRDWSTTNTVSLTGGIINSTVNKGAFSTLTVNNSDTSLFSGTLSGSGAFTKAGAGTLALSAQNSFTGTLNVNGGVLEFSNAGSGNSNVYGSTQININNGATLKVSGPAGNIQIFNGRNYTFDATGGGAILLGTGNYNAVSTPFSITTTGGARNNIGLITTSGPFSFNLGQASVVATFDVALGSDASSDLTVTPNIVNAGSIMKSGTGRLTFTGTNSYNGTTTVSVGTLALVGGSQASPITVENLASLGFTLGSPTTSTKAVTFNTGSSVKITGTPAPATSYTLITTTDTISGPLALDPLVPGFELQLDVTNKILSLVPVAGGGYSDWKTANSTAQTIDQDHDNDGVANGVEYFLGGTVDTTGYTTPPPSVASNLGVLSVTWTKAATYPGTAVYGTDYMVETSETLTGAWTPETFGGGNITENGDDVKYTFPSPLGSKKFARLKVTGP